MYTFGRNKSEVHAGMARPSGKFAVGFSNFSFVVPGYTPRLGIPIDPTKVYLICPAVCLCGKIINPSTAIVTHTDVCSISLEHFSTLEQLRARRAADRAGYRNMGTLKASLPRVQLCESFNSDTLVPKLDMGF